MRSLTTIIVAIVFVCLIIGFTSLFIVQQGHAGIILRLGRLVQDSHTNKAKVYGPGLHIKMPFVEGVRIFDTRLQTLDIKSSKLTRIVTKEKKDVIVDYYVKWRIADLARYFTATGGNQLKAETLLEQQLNTSLRAEFGKRTISEVVSGDRDDVMEVLRKRADTQAAQLGMYVVDVRIKGIELPANTSDAIYERMRADMRKIANKHRADGSASAEAIRAAADAQVTVLLAKANSDGQTTRAHGQAKAAAIYSQAYGQNKEFFALYRSLKAYEGSLKSKDDILVLDPSMSFFEYFRKGAK